MLCHQNTTPPQKKNCKYKSHCVFIQSCSEYSTIETPEGRFRVFLGFFYNLLAVRGKQLHKNK